MNNEHGEVDVICTWHRPQDRLPEDREEVLVIDKYTDYMMCAEFNYERGWSGNALIKLWASKPMPPKELEDE